MLRLFVGVIPPPAALEHLAAVVAALHGREGEPRWVPPERWHITLAFLGSVEESDVPRLRRELAVAAAENAPLRLRIHGAGTFPARRRPAVLWAGLSGDLDPLERLARSTRRAARRARQPRDAKPFSPHLTLGRWRPSDSTDRALADALAGYSGPEFGVDRVILLRSHPGPKPRYENIDSWALG